MSTEHFVCPDCGPHVKADGDGCCAMCGRDCGVAACSAIPACRLERDLATVRGQLVAKIEEIRLLCDCWAEDHTHAQQIVRKHDPSADVEGDKFGVPGIEDLVDMLDEMLVRKDARITTLQRDWAEQYARAEAAEARVREVEAEAERDTLREIIGQIHDAIGEARESDDDSLPDVVREIKAAVDYQTDLKSENIALRAADAGHLSRIDGLKTRVEMLTKENAELRGDLREMAMDIVLEPAHKLPGKPTDKAVWYVSRWVRESTVAIARRHAAPEEPQSAPADTNVESYAPNGTGDEREEGS